MRTFLLLLLALVAAPIVHAQGPPSEFVLVDRQPAKISGDNPAYPDTLRRAGIEGRVVVRAWIGKDGRVKDVEVLRTDHDGFNANTVRAVRTWRFEPAEKDGQPVEVWLTIPVRFRQEKTSLPPEPLEAPLSDEDIERRSQQAATFEQRLRDAVANSPRSEAECRALPPATLDLSGGELQMEGTTTAKELFGYMLCIESGHTFVVNSAVLGDQGPTSEADAHAAGERLGRRAMQHLLARTEAQCRVLPQVTLVFGSETATFNHQPPSAAQMDYVACATSRQTMWLKGVESGGQSLTPERIEAQTTDLFFRILADYLGLTVPD